MATRNFYSHKDDIEMIRHALYKIKQNPSVALKGMEAWEDFQQFGSVIRTTTNLCSHFRKAVQTKLDKFRSEFKWEDLHPLYINLQLTPDRSVLQRLEDFYGITISTNSDGTLVRKSKVAVGEQRRVPRKQEIKLDDDSDSTDGNVSIMSRIPTTPVNFNITEQVMFIKDTAGVRCRNMDQVVIQAPIATSTPKAEPKRRLTMTLRDRGVPSPPECKRMKITRPDRVPSPPCNDTDVFPDRQPDIFFDADHNSPSPLADLPVAAQHPEASTSVVKEREPVKVASSVTLDAPGGISIDRRQSLFVDVWKLVEDLGIKSDVISDLLKKVEQEMANKASNEEDYRKCIRVVLDGISKSVLTFSQPDYESLTTGNSKLELEEHAHFSTAFREACLNKIFEEQIGQLMILQKQFRNDVLISEQAILEISKSEKEYETRLVPIVNSIKKSLLS